MSGVSIESSGRCVRLLRDVPADRRDEGWLRRSDWSPRTARLSPPNPAFYYEKPFWIKSPGPCPAPMRYPIYLPDGAIGDIWQCADCGLLWRIDQSPLRGHRPGMGWWRCLPLWRQVAFRQGWWRP